MKKYAHAFLFFVVALSCASSVWAQKVAVFGELVYTMAGDPIENGLVLMEDGKITYVGSGENVRIGSDFNTHTMSVVTPGLIDAHSVIGLAGYLNQPHDQDQLETSSPFQPDLRAIDAYNAREALVDWVRGLGVTTVHTGHGPGAIVSGQTMVVKTDGETVDEAVLVPEAMVAATLGEGISGAFQSPGTRSKAVAMLRTELVKAQEYRKKFNDAEEGKEPPRDLKMETMVRVLNGELPLLVTVHKAHDILTAIRVADEFGFRLVLDGVAEAYLVLDEIKASGAQVILHPTMMRPGGDAENASFETAKTLHEAGIPFSLQSGYEGYVPKTRVVLYEAGLAAGYGLPFEAALASITTEPARLLGIDDRVGSLKVGMDADIAGFDGDPFEYTSHACLVVVNGRVVSETCR